MQSHYERNKEIYKQRAILHYRRNRHACIQRMKEYNKKYYASKKNNVMLKHQQPTKSSIERLIITFD